MRKIFIFILMVLSFSIKDGEAQNQPHWPHWRGPHFNGISEATMLPVHWSDSENIAWKTELPSWSAGTPIIWSDQIFITSPSKADKKFAGDNNQASRRSYRDPGGSKLLLLCISKRTGKIQWQYQLDDKNKLYRKQNDSSPSPVTDGRFVWVVTGTGIVTALDMLGNKIWQKNLQQEYGKFGLNFGYASSPLLFDGKIFIEVLHGYRTEEPSYLISIDGKTGKTLWRQIRKTDAEEESKDAYTTPVLYNNNGAPQVVISGGDYITGHELETGIEIWRIGGMNPTKNRNFRVIATPIVVGDIIYIPTRIKPLQAYRIGGVGDISKTNLLWRWEGSGGPDVPSPLCDGTYFYIVDDKGRITCLDAQTGCLIWGPERTSEGIVSASPILADGKIYVVNEKAVTTVVAAGSEFNILATNQLDDSYTLASPAVSGNQLFIRTALYLYCIGK